MVIDDFSRRNVFYGLGTSRGGFTFSILLQAEEIHPSSFILQPSSFNLLPSSFNLLPLASIPPLIANSSRIHNGNLFSSARLPVRARHIAGRSRFFIAVAG
jgi:hypothetical protein